jgi:glycosyltransferase involved in cell wall biosynthesis
VDDSMAQRSDLPDRSTASPSAHAGAKPVVEVLIFGTAAGPTLDCLRRSTNETPFRITTIASEYGHSPLDDASAEIEAGEVASEDWLLALCLSARLAGVRGRRDIVVLAAGTLVFGNWLDRLRAAAYGATDIGTASAFTNHGKMGAYPAPGFPHATTAWDWRRLDRAAAEENAGQRVELPMPAVTCLYLRRHYLDHLLGSACHRSGAGRWRHVLAADVCAALCDGGPLSPFLAGRNGDPTDHRAAAALNAFLDADPLGILRRPIDLALLQGSGPAMLLITHIGGGGTERHVRDMADALEQEAVRAIILRPTLDGRLRLERLAAPHTPNLIFDPATEYYTLLRALRTLGIVHAHVHHLMGHPPETERAVAALGVRYDWTIHDYMSICPRIQLMGREGRYCGEPAPGECNRCLAQMGTFVGQRDGTEILRWRARFLRSLKEARRVFVPHPEVAARMKRYAPDVEFIVRGHIEKLPQARPVAACLDPDQPLRVVLIGLLMPHKGLNVLAECAKDALCRALPLSFHVLGAADPADRLLGLENVEIRGEYREEEVFDHLEDLGCHCAWFPSVLPESYCYTLSIAEAGGLYALGFDLGAQGARIRQRGWGQVMPLDTRPPQINEVLLRVREQLAKSSHGPPARFAHYDQLLRDYYGLPDFGVPSRSGLAAALAIGPRRERAARGQPISIHGRRARAAA